MDFEGGGQRFCTLFFETKNSAFTSTKNVTEKGQFLKNRSKKTKKNSTWRLSVEKYFR